MINRSRQLVDDYVKELSLSDKIAVVTELTPILYQRFPKLMDPLEMLYRRQSQQGACIFSGDAVT